MSGLTRRWLATSGTASLLLCGWGIPAFSQSPVPASNSATVLPEVVVTAPRTRSAPPSAPRHVRVVSGGRRRSAKPASATPLESAEQVHARAIADQNRQLDAARANLFSPAGASTYEVGRQALEAQPQGTNTPLDKALLQVPGISQDSAASGSLHVRNEHANLQYRINGIMLPDGVGAFGQIVDTGIVGRMTLITGALPAQYGLRTAGVLDIQTRADAFSNSGSVSAYGGSHGTITASAEYGGTIGQTQYYVSGRYFGSDLGIENPTPAYNAIHDKTSQEKGFAYVSTAIDQTSRVTYIGGISNGAYQIPNNPGKTPAFTAFGISDFDSAKLNERQREFNQFNVVAYQKSGEGFDYQIAYFNRYSQLHFRPDIVGDLVFNGVASDVYRQSFINGIQEDTSYRIGFAHTLKFGFGFSAERSLVNNGSTVLPLDSFGNPSDAPFQIFDSSSKTGYLLSSYLADEWRITNQLTLNAGVRFDQMWQYSDANQLSPRANLTWKPYDGTIFHAGYARNFTPPQQVLAAPTNLGLVQNTSAQPGVAQNDPVRPERSHVFDVGVLQNIYTVPGLQLGVDAYYKTARDLLDDGQFGAAYVLSAFNYAKGFNQGVELSATYTNGNFRAYGNLAWAKQMATQVVSNQYLIDPNDLAYIASHYIYTDHAQTLTASAGASYLWQGTRFSANLIYGSGLRNDSPDGVPNGSHVPAYTQVNLGTSHDFNFVSATKPTTFRFDIVNVFDKIYAIRDGSGVGVFAPQYGPRRGFYVGLSQKL